MTCYCHFCMEFLQYIERHQKIDNSCCINQLGITLRTFSGEIGICLLSLTKVSIKRVVQYLLFLNCKFSFVVHSIVFADD